METLFVCMHHIKQCTTDSGSILGMIFSNCETFCDVIEAYLTDHKLVYCVIDKFSDDLHEVQLSQCADMFCCQYVDMNLFKRPTTVFLKFMARVQPN